MAHPMIDRLRPVPLYHQLKELLQDRMELGEWPPGSRIPTEKELAATYMVSQITVRQALARLASEGLVERCQGRGTFVCQASVSHDLLRLAGFSDGLARSGVEVETRLLSATEATASEGVARRLNMAYGEPVIKIVRVRSRDGTPIALQTSHLNATLCRPLLGRDLERESLFRLLTEVCGLELVRAEEAVSAVAVDDYEAEILSVASGSPALLIQRTTYDRRGRPVEFVKSVLRGDKCKFTVTLDAEPKARDAGVDGQRLGLQTKLS